MAKDTVTTTVAIHITSCAVCGVSFGVPEGYLEARRKDGRTIWCPNGHTLGWAETEADRLRKEIASVKGKLDQTQALADSWRKDADKQYELRKATERQLSATRGVVTRIKNRVKNGVCPCCNRHFENLQRHMGTKHPDWQPEE